MLVFVFYPEHGTLDSVCLIQNEVWNLASGLIGCDEQMGWGETGRLLQRMKSHPQAELVGGLYCFIPAYSSSPSQFPVQQPGQVEMY